MFRTIFITLLSIFYFLFSQAPASAAENWIIDSFDSKINILEDGKVQITETIDVNFGTEKHGIFRDIPYIYYTDKGNNIYTDVQIERVLQDTTLAKYQSSKTGNFLRLKIGDPNRTISGRHSYEIRYLARGVLRSFEDHDELFWDTTGNGWPVPIRIAASTVTLPKPGIINITCYQGVSNATNPCSSRIVNKSSTVFSATRPLNIGEGLTIVVGYTKGMVPILIVTPPPSTTPTSTPLYPPNLLISLLTFLSSIVFIIWLWKKKGKDQTSGHEAIVVEYTPPNKLRPAEVGTLLDERADTLDVSATIIDLAVRGFLTIEEVPKKWLFGSVDYILTQTEMLDQGRTLNPITHRVRPSSNKDEKLLNYELELLQRLFSGTDTVNMSELKEEFYDDLVKVKKSLYQDVIDKSLFTKNPETVKTIYGMIGFFIFIISIIISFVGLTEPSGNISGIAIGTMFGGLVFFILSRSFSRRTAVGYELYRKTLGFRMFIEKAEKYKQQYLERENIFSELLPYAIVFGATGKFANAFKVLGIEPKQPTWYASSQPFNPVLFSSNINNFSSSMTSTIASQPRSNSFASSGSGFSSGGSSGGGFGGGGGGSW